MLGKLCYGYKFQTSFNISNQISISRTLSILQITTISPWVQQGSPNREYGYGNKVFRTPTFLKIVIIILDIYSQTALLSKLARILQF